MTLAPLSQYPLMNHNRTHAEVRNRKHPISTHESYLQLQVNGGTFQDLRNASDEVDDEWKQKIELNHSLECMRAFDKSFLSKALKGLSIGGCAAGSAAILLSSPILGSLLIAQYTTLLKVFRDDSTILKNINEGRMDIPVSRKLIDQLFIALHLDKDQEFLLETVIPVNLPAIKIRLPEGASLARLGVGRQILNLPELRGGVHAGVTMEVKASPPIQSIFQYGVAKKNN